MALQVIISCKYVEMWRLRLFFYLVALYVVGTILSISFLEKCSIGLTIGFAAFLIVTIIAITYIYLRETRNEIIPFIVFYLIGSLWGCLGVLRVKLVEQRLVGVPIVGMTLYRIENVGQSRKGKLALTISVAEGNYKGIRGIIYINPNNNFSNHIGIKKISSTGNVSIIGNNSRSGGNNYSGSSGDNNYRGSSAGTDFVNSGGNSNNCGGSIIGNNSRSGGNNYSGSSGDNNYRGSSAGTDFVNSGGSDNDGGVSSGDFIRGDFIIKYKYNRYKYTHFYGFGKQGEYEIVRCKRPALWWRLVRLNKLAGRRIERMVGDGDQGAILKALLLGDKSSITTPLRNNFAKSGASHLLALSGLHLGILAGVLIFIISLFGNSSVVRVLRCIVVVVVLWGYSLFTSLGVSIFRGVVMASFYEILRLFDRESSGYSALALAALVIVLTNPFASVQIGFQLSFCAVLGILVLSKYVKISVACQIFTAPLVWYYFGTFSHYYLLTNLLCIPIVSVIMISAPIITMVADVPMIGEVLCRGLKWAIWLLCYIVEVIASLPQ